MALSDAEEMGYCYKGRCYYLVAPNGDATSCGNPSPPADGGAPPCHDKLFTPPQNIGELIGNIGDWEGITKEELIAG